MNIAEKLANKARNSISKYCYTECNAYCCRKGFLQMTQKQAQVVMKKGSKEGITWSSEKRVLLKLEHTNKGCPSLQDFKCTIHKNRIRPIACKRFPVFLWSNKRLRLSPRCPAVQADLLYSYVAKFKKLGYSLTTDENTNTYNK